MARHDAYVEALRTVGTLAQNSAAPAGVGTPREIDYP